MDQDDWDFAGNDDAKVTMRAAIRYLLGALPAAPAAILWRGSLRSCARSRTSHHVAGRIPSMMNCRAAELAFG
jgi:hypothetical protein